jgi:uncharacterized protein YhaN
MRIDRLHIDGFGRALDTRIDLGPGLTLVKGPNGTGKTTVHEFIHAILFGLVKDQFPLVRGGTRGGRISGVLATGEAFEVVRHGDAVTGAGQKWKVTLADADPALGPDARLALVTGGVTREVFESVFAFGQDELHNLKTLTAKEVADRIYGASIGVIGDVLKVEASLGGEIDNLWKRAGQNPAINRSVTRLAGLQADLARRNLPEEYGALRRQLEAIGQQRVELDQRLAALEVERREVALLRGALVPWQAMVEARAALALVPAGDVVTADDLAEEARLAQAVSAAEAQTAQALAAREELDRQSAEVTYRVDVLDRSVDIETAVTRASNDRAREADVAAQRRRHAALGTAMGEALAEAGWTEASLDGFDPLAVRTALAAHHRDDIEGPERAALAPAERARLAAEDEARAHDAVERLAAGARLEAAAPLEGSASGSSAGDPDALDAEAARLASDIARAEGLRASIAATPVQPVGPTGGGAPAGGTRVAGGPLVPALAVGGIGVVAGIVLAMLVNPLLGVVLAVAGLGIAAFMVLRAGGRSSGGAGAPAAHPMAATLLQLETELDQSFLAAGLQLPPNAAGPAELRRRAAAIREAEAGRREADIERREATATRERAAAALTAATAERATAEAAVAAAAGSVEAGRGRWSAALIDAGLPSSLDNATAMGLVSRLEAAQVAQVERADLGRSLGRTERERLEWEQGVARLALDLGIPADGEADALVERLRQELAGARTNQRRKEALVTQRDVAGTAERAANDGLAVARVAYGEFLAGHGAASAEQLRERHGQTSDRGRAELRLHQAEASFAGIVPEERRAELEPLLRTAEAATLAARAAVIGEDVATVGAERDTLVAREGEITEQLRRLASEADTSRIRQELADGRASLEADALRWYVLRTGLALLRRTRAEYEAKHRPAVLARAETLFLDWTGDEYRGFDRLSETGLQGIVARADDKVVPLAGLSRGTAEQLYLAMRFALVEHLATQQEPLPIIMDDVLVNFDPERAQRVARTIEKVAAERQVIYLTCHAEVAIQPTRTIVLGRNVEVASVTEHAPAAGEPSAQAG